MFVFVLCGTALAKKMEPVAKIAKITGEVQLKQPGKEEWIKASENMPLHENSRVRALKASDAVIEWAKGHAMKIYELTEIAFTQLGVDKKGRETTGLEMPGGRLLALVKKFDDSKSVFTVRTPAAYAGVRGTQFTAESDAGKSAFATLEGKIAVTAQNVEVVLEANYQTSVETGMPPAEPQLIPQEKIDALKKEVKVISDVSEQGKSEAGAGKGANAQEAAQQDAINQTQQQIIDQQTQDAINNSVEQQGHYDPYYPGMP